MAYKNKEKQKEYHAEWYKKHRDERLTCKKLYREAHRDETLIYKKQWYEQNKDKCRQWTKAWIKNHREQYHEIERRKNFKRRSLGFIPLNECFEGSEAHHVDENRVIYIPKEIHQSIRHNVWTGQNMTLINSLAFDYLLETLLYENIFLPT